MTKASDNVFPRFLVSEGGSTTTPASGNVTMYAKADGLLYSKDDAGTETLVSGGSSGSFVLPTFVAAGISATGTGDITPGLPAGGAADDILLLFVQSNNQAVTAPAGYAQLGPQVGTGTAAVAGGTRLATFWKRHVGGAEAAPTVTDTGDHTLGQIMAIRGCTASGNPFVSIGQGRKVTASTTGTAIAGATHLANCLVVNAFAHSLDSASAVFSAFTNADLTSVTERIDVATADGNGGGIGVSTGSKVAAGSFTATTVTETSTTDVSTTFYLIPTGGTTAGAVDAQDFTTSDTWAKPAGAKIVEMSAQGAGASGSAGRNAATAAGGGGGGGGARMNVTAFAGTLSATMTVAVGAGGAATANTDGAASNGGGASSVTDNSKIICYGDPGRAAGASSSGSGGVGGNGGGLGPAAAAAGTTTYDVQQPGGGTGGTTAQAGGSAIGQAGGAGAGGGTTQAASSGGVTQFGGGGGGGGRANTNVGTGGGAILGGQISGGATASAAGTDSPYPRVFGGSGGAGGTSASGQGGIGGWPGGGGGGGGSQVGAQRGEAGADGIVTITTRC